MTTIDQGMSVLCQPNGNMEFPFIARVDKCYENAAMVTIIDFDPRDRFNVQDLAGRAVIGFRQMKETKSCALMHGQALSS